MRILQIINSLNIGGAEQLVVGLIPRLRKLGCEVDLCIFNGTDSDLTRRVEELQATTCKGMRFHRLARTGKEYSPKYIPKLRHLLSQYDIAHAHNTSAQFTLAVASIGLRRLKLITTEHNTDNRRRHYLIFKPIDRWMYMRYGKIVAISQPAKDNLINYLPSLHQKVTVINNGVDVNLFHNAIPYHQGELKDFYDKPVNLDGEKNIIQVAAFRAQKDQKTLIDSLKFLPPNFVVWLVGDGPMHKEIHNYADRATANLEDGKSRIVFFGNRKDVARLLRTADIVCMSTHYEGLSLSNLEGMSAGKPFVASDVEGIREVTSGYGILCPPRDSKALANAFIHLATNSDYAASVADRCYYRACQYSIEKTAEEYARVYKNLLKIPTKPHKK